MKLKKLHFSYGEHIFKQRHNSERYTMAGKLKEPNIGKTTAFVEAWNANGGLLTKAQAARMLDVTPGHVNKSFHSLSLELIEVNGKNWITFQSVYREFLRRKELFRN